MPGKLKTNKIKTKHVANPQSASLPDFYKLVQKWVILLVYAGINLQAVLYLVLTKNHELLYLAETNIVSIKSILFICT